MCLDVFISGETINLCIPTQKFALESNWYSWFNDSKINRFLEQGGFPNTPEKQEKFYLSQLNERIIFIISTKNGIYKGVVSLSALDMTKKSCDIAIVTDKKIEEQLSPYAALEAMALTTEHGFVKLGMQRISAGQHILLAKWQQRLELLGYKLEGIHEGKFSKGQERSDSMSIACNYNDYLLIKKNRGGVFWDGLELMKQRVRKLPTESYKDQLSNFYNTHRSNYYTKIFEL